MPFVLLRFVNLYIDKSSVITRCMSTCIFISQSIIMYFFGFSFKSRDGKKNLDRLIIISFSVFIFEKLKNCLTTTFNF